MDGTEKKRVDIIGKSGKPRCFRSTKSLPVNYYNNKKGWMTSELMHQIMSKLNNRMIKENQNILMFVDNCSSHPIGLQLSVRAEYKEIGLFLRTLKGHTHM